MSWETMLAALRSQNLAAMKKLAESPLGIAGATGSVRTRSSSTSLRRSGGRYGPRSAARGPIGRANYLMALCRTFTLLAEQSQTSAAPFTNPAYVGGSMSLALTDLLIELSDPARLQLYRGDPESFMQQFPNLTEDDKSAL